ncbi:1215_t:CDS:2 [Funneliformis mosseae]|uniref:1215_t:CDS:1 n=1 Tax=Funneliformis mosseae TaxID=27381 RepID=A0A9N9GR17_FUNMO|nr:1215_t:CDS:2 [Funneliformis mosseae]
MTTTFCEMRMILVLTLSQIFQVVDRSQKDGSDLAVLEIDLPSIKTKKRENFLGIFQNIFQTERIDDKLFIKSEVHSSLMISIKQQLPNWWIQIDNKSVVNGNEFRPDVGGWNP